MFKFLIKLSWLVVYVKDNNTLLYYSKDKCVWLIGIIF